MNQLMQQVKKNKHWWLIGAGGFILILVLILGWRHGRSEIPANESVVKNLTEFNVANHIELDANLYQQIIDQAEIEITQGQKIESNQPIKGAVVPHHLLAGQFSARLFAQLRQQNPKTIILVGPNHENVGVDPIISSLNDWQSAAGTLKADKNLINQLAKEKIISVEDDIITNEHSITDLIPLLQFYLPDTKIVPLIFKQQVSPEQSQRLVNALALILKDDQVTMVSSIDFSHYLSQKQADENDAATLRLIQAGNSNQLMKLDSDYLDSPVSLVTLMKVMDSVGAQKLQVIDHANAAQLSKGNNASTTSYFFLVYTP